MCPVKAAVAIVQRIVEYDLPPDVLKDTKINYVQFECRGFTIPATMILQRIRQVVDF
jgi:hypothetical protein